MDFAGEKLRCRVAPAKLLQFVEIAVIELAKHGLQQIESAADIANDAVGIE